MEDFRETVIASLAELKTDIKHLLKHQEEDTKEIKKIPTLETKAKTNRGLIFIIFATYIPILFAMIKGMK